MTDKLSDELSAQIRVDGAPVTMTFTTFLNILDRVKALEQQVERLERLERACIKLYLGKIAKTEWRHVVRNGPLAKKLIALAEKEA